MKTTIKFSVVAVLAFALLFSCKKANYEESEDQVPDTISKSVISSSAAVEKNVGNRKFIRTADIKFKVKDVAKSTYEIENATTKFGGYVTYTNLQSSISEKNKTNVSQDSTLETTKFTVENNITIRVPNTKLDTVIKTIAKQINFLDYRIIKADDVSLQMLSNQLSKTRNSEKENRLEKAIDTKGKKLNSIMDAEDKLALEKEKSDDRTINNLSLQDQVNFSTLTLEIYQNETVKQEMVAREKSASNYNPHLGIQIVDGLKTGWIILENIIAFVVQLWSLILIGIIGYLIYKKQVKK